MISARALDQAVAEAIVTAEQAARLREIEQALAPQTQGSEPQDEESLRFLTGFADIFVTMGLVLFLGALAFLMGSGTGTTLTFAGLAACAWVLAEFFTFKRRMALPSIVLLVVFVASIFALCAQVFTSLLPGQPTTIANGFFPTAQSYLPLALAAAVTAVLAGVHYLHFRVPITIAAGVAALCVLVVSLVVGLVPRIGGTTIDAVLFVCGLVVFALAMRFDMSDPMRATRRTDIAFWLHLLAAPLIVHPLMAAFLAQVGRHEQHWNETSAALGVIWLFLLLAAVAVIIDRRALLVSGLAYAGVAAGVLVNRVGISKFDFTFSTVALVLGLFILLLSAGWSPLRRALLKRLPPRLAGRLPHPLVVSNA